MSPALPRTCARSTSSNGKVGVIGYCSGGRQSVLAACNLDLDAAVDCYGAFVVGTPPDGFPLQVTNLVDQLPNLRAPLLGLFGKDDQYPIARAGRRARFDPHSERASRTSSTATRAPGTPSSRWTDPPTAPRPRTTAGSGSKRSTPPTSEAEMCTYMTVRTQLARQREGPRQQLVRGHRRHRLLRPSGPRDGRAHAQHRLRQPGRRAVGARRGRAHCRLGPRARRPRSRPRSTPRPPSSRADGAGPAHSVAVTKALV